MLNIDWPNFTPYSAALGGAMIGTAAAYMLYSTGRIAGISGIVGGIFKKNNKSELMWRSTFTGGLLTGGALTHFLLNSIAPENKLPEITFDYLTLVAAGILVGFGTRLGNGCTSGHGVCGLSRLSSRSLVATSTFMASGILTSIISPSLSPISKLLVAAGCVTPCAVVLLQQKPPSTTQQQQQQQQQPSSSEDSVSTMHAISTGISGLIFGSGLAVSGMTDPNKVISFLHINDLWDPSLAFVMGSAVAIGTLTFKYILPKNTKENVSRMPLFGRKWYVPTRNDVDLRLIAGATLFGMGWGMAGMCPGPALVVSPFSAKGVLFATSMLSSMTLFNMVS